VGTLSWPPTAITAWPLTLARRNGNLDLYITTLVFGSDLHRSRGHYRQALANLEIVFDDNELYARPYTRVWARFYRGMALCATGRSVTA
jgi:hypothetical protein